MTAKLLEKEKENDKLKEEFEKVKSRANDLEMRLGNISKENNKIKEEVKEKEGLIKKNSKVIQDLELKIKESDDCLDKYKYELERTITPMNKSFTTEEVKEIVKDKSQIKDPNTFMFYMNCIGHDRKNDCFLACKEFHNFCFQCLKKFYESNYKDVNKLLLDKYICPICQKSSIVEQSHDSLKNLFGNEYENFNK